jgi:hypothetical protein
MTAACPPDGAATERPFGLLRHTSIRRKIHTVGTVALTFGLSRNQDRTHRIFESTVENTLRVKVDSLSTGLLSVRAMCEHAQRRGEDRRDVLTGASERPGMRHFDLAERDRDRFTLVGSYAGDQLGVNISSAIGAMTI